MRALASRTVALVAGVDEREVLRLLELWCSAGVVTEVIWVTPDDISHERAGPPRVAARLVRKAGSREGDLFELLSGRRTSLLRFLVVQLITHATAPDPLVGDEAQLLADMLEDAAPRSPTAEGRTGTRIQRISVVVPESRVTGTPPGVLLSGWDVNIVVAAEDRPGLAHGNVFVRSPGNFASHAAAAIASIGGLWSGVGAGVFDGTDTDSTLAEGDLVVARSSVRVILGEDSSENMARQAMAVANDDPSGPAQILPWARLSSDPGALTSRALQHVLALEGWRPSAMAQAPERTQGETGFRVALGDAARFNAQMFSYGARLLVRKGWERAEAAATEAIVGTESDTVVRLRPRGPDAMVGLAEARLDELDRILRAEAARAETESVPAPSPRMWQSVRHMCFSLVDGGDLPDGFPAPELGGLRELAPPSAVSPDPQDAPPVPLAPDGQMCTDPRLVQEALSHLAEADGKAQEEHAGHGDDASPRDERRAARRRSSEVAADRADELTRLRDWLGRRRRSLTWRAAEEVAERMSRLREEEGLLASAEVAAPPSDRLLAAERRVRRAWWFAAVWLLLTLVVTLIYLAATELWLVASLAVPALFQVLPLALLIVAHHGYYRAHRKYEWATEHALTERRRLAERRVFLRREQSRLELVYSALGDWAEIISRHFHAPWRPEVARQIEPTEELVASFPAAAGLAKPLDEEKEAARRAAMTALRVICHPGWSADDFEHLAADVEGADKKAQGFLEADLDTSDSPLSPRRRILEACRDGSARTQASVRAIERVRAAVSEGALPLPDRAVEDLGRFAEGNEMTERDFFDGALEGKTVFSRDQWTPSGLQRERHVPATMIAWVPGVLPGRRDGIEIYPSAGPVSLRVDISPRASTTDLTLFSGGEAEEFSARAQPRSAIEDMMQGEWM